MKPTVTLIVNAFAWSLLLVVGFGLAEWLSPSGTVYPILLGVCLITAGLFMKFSLPL